MIFRFSENSFTKTFRNVNIRIIYMNFINTACVEDTATNHTNQMGDFKTPMCFGRVLPPNHRPHGMGVGGPPYGGLWGHITLI